MPIKQPTRGVQTKQEVQPSTEWRDIRTWGEKFRSWAEQGDALFVMGLLSLAAMLMMPQYIEAIFIFSMLLFKWAKGLEFTLPFRMPATAKQLDHSDPDLSTGGKKSAIGDGIAFLGNDRVSRKELWLKGDDMRTHLLVFGSTGAGKALRDDERVLTPSGWQRMDSLAEGDWVMTPDGLQTKILGVYPQGELPLWEVILEDGRRLEASGDHLWEAVGPDAAPQQIRTEELAARLPEGTWMFPLATAREMPACSYPLEQASDALLRRLRLGQDLPECDVGTLAERKKLTRTLQQSLPVRQDSAGKQTWRLGNRPAAHWIAALLRSQGAIAHVEESQGTWNVLARWNEQSIRVARVTALHRKAPCRCIELADPRGLFVAGEDVVTHNTETLISLAFNSLVQGSGFIYVDGKGDNSLWAKIFSICRSMGREDDLLVVNYMTGGRDVFGPQKNKLSNTLNPFSNGSAGGLTELLVGLMDESGGDNAMWKGRAITLISGVMFALVYMRENEGLLLDVDEIRNYLILENIQKLADSRNLPANILQSIRAYLRSLPGYVDKAPKQSETVMDQHGYLQMQFTRILGSLSDTYGYIFRTNLGEVDFVDVVVNRRVLVVLLPALEKSQEELGNLGKIIVASLKQMMATGLGDTLEGDYTDIIEIKPTNSPAPYMCILDEYGYYVVKGAAVMPAQARSLGFCMVFAGQDYPAFKKNNNSEEAVSTIGNCNVKIFMKVEDPTETFDLFKQSVGEALVSKTGGYSFESGIGIGGYMDRKDASIERRSRGDLLDLKDQAPGEAHIIFKSTLVRAQMFYVNPAKPKRVQLNHFLRVEPPDRKKMLELDTKFNELQNKLTNRALIKDYIDSSHPLPRPSMAQKALLQMLDNGQSPAAAIGAAIAAVHQMSYNTLDTISQSMNADQGTDDEDEGDLNERIVRTRNVFSGGPTTPPPPPPPSYDNKYDTQSHEHKYVGDLDDEHGTGSGADVFMNEEETKRNIEEMEVSAGMDRDKARVHANELADDMRLFSSYPNPQVQPEMMDSSDIVDIIKEIKDDLDERTD